MSQTDRLALAAESGALVLPDTGSIVVLRAEPGPFLHVISRDRLICEQSFRPVCDALASQGFDAVQRAEVSNATLAVVNLTRSRAENLGNVARALTFLAPDTTLAINGSKTDGVDSLLRQVAKAIPIEDAFIKSHGRVAWLRRPETLPAEAAEWRAASEPSRNSAGFLTRPGIFSPDQPDPGSRLLAETISNRLKGRIADLGAGWGWLADAALKSCPGITTLDLYEAEALALDMARQNIADPRAEFHWTDVTTLGRGTAPYDTVICNPPFHQGRAADPNLGQGFITAAARILKPGGTLYLVANRQLPYERTFEAAFIEHDRIAEDRHFKVLTGRRPRKN